LHRSTTPLPYPTLFRSQYSAPDDSIARVIGGTSGASWLRWLTSASGRSTWILWVISGAVIMKMISSTSITSTRGVTLISAIGVRSEEHTSELQSRENLV